MGNNIYDWFGINQGIFLSINTIHTPALDQFMLFVTFLGHPRLFPFYIASILLLMWLKPAMMPQRNVVTFAVSYIVTAIFFVPLLKTFFDYPRPLIVLGKQNVTVLGTPDTLHSFPSGHSAFAILLAASLIPGIPRPGKIALVIFSLLVCVSRIAVGAHFPADIVGSFMLVLPVVFIVRFVIGPFKAGNCTNFETMEGKSNTKNEAPGRNL